MGVSYSLLGTDFTVNNAWAAAGQSSTAERQMKQSLKRGSYAQLDLYFLSDLGGGLLGFCYFPVANPTTTDRTLDGCINLAGSLPGAEATNYDMGLTAVHEVGHWFGLYHVFQGQSCTGNGDSVADTPIQRVATQGCPTSQDSCPNAAGADSVSALFQPPTSRFADHSLPLDPQLHGLLLRCLHVRVHQRPEQQSHFSLHAVPCWPISAYRHGTEAELNDEV